MDQFPSAESRPPGPGSELSLPARSRHDVVLLSPVGRLDLSTYARLRDGLLKHMIEQPRAVIVVLGPGFEIGSDPMTSVFVSVWTRCQGWSSTPLLLAATTAGHRRMLARNGVPRFLPCHDGVSAALDAVGDPPPRQRDQAQLPLDVDTDHLARDFTRRTCRAWEGLHEVTPRAVLLAGELAGLARSTAIPGTMLVLLLERRPGHLAVVRRRPFHHRARHDQDAPAEHGLRHRPHARRARPLGHPQPQPPPTPPGPGPLTTACAARSGSHRMPTIRPQPGRRVTA